MNRETALWEWLAIPVTEHPPTHYRLLGVPAFEANQEVIRNAADRQYSHVKRLAVNEFTDVGQALLDEIMAAKVCLLNPEKKATYDEKLRGERQPATKRETTTPPNTTSAAEEITQQSLLVGADPRCEIEVGEDSVSAVHCKVIRDKNQLQIRDMGSTNGTYVNLQKIKSASLKPTDIVTLGPNVLLRLPESLLPPPFRDITMRIVGRSPQCDVRIDDPSVSQIHAKVFRVGSDTYIEDLRSTNGTRLVVGGSAVRVVQRVKLDQAAAVLFGSHKIDAAELI